MSPFFLALVLAWSPNPEPNIAGYRVFTGAAPRSYVSFVDVGNVTQATMANPPPGVNRYYALTAYNTAGFESGFSSEIVFQVSPTPTPSPSPTPTATATATSTATATFTPTATATVTATATASATATIVPSPTPALSVSISPASQTAGSTVTVISKTYTVSEVRSNFSGIVTLTVSGLPVGVEAAFATNPSVAKRTLTLMVPWYLPPGSYPFTVTARASGSLSSTATATIVKTN